MRLVDEPSSRLPVRGDPPKSYGFPIGWCRFGLHLPAGMDAQRMDARHVAFHGTKSDAAVAILTGSNPQLLTPGTETESGFTLPIRPGHIAGGFTRINRRSGATETFDPNQIFMSPTIKYCEEPAYTEFERSGVRGVTFKTAFQVRIAGGAYSAGQETVGARERRIDPLFSNDEVEWYTRRIGAPVLYGLLIKVDDGAARAMEAEAARAEADKAAADDACVEAAAAVARLKDELKAAERVLKDAQARAVAATAAASSKREVCARYSATAKAADDAARVPTRKPRRPSEEPGRSHAPPSLASPPARTPGSRGGEEIGSWNGKEIWAADLALLRAVHESIPVGQRMESWFDRTQDVGSWERVTVERGRVTELE